MNDSAIFSTLADALNKLEIATRQGRVTLAQYANGAEYLTGRIESIRARLADPAAGLLVIRDESPIVGGHGPAGWDFI